MVEVTREKGPLLLPGEGRKRRPLLWAFVWAGLVGSAASFLYVMLR